MPAWARTLAWFAATLAGTDPVSADPLVVVPGVTVSEEYTDNVFFREDAEPDFLTRLQLTLAGTYRTPRTSTTASTATSAVYFARRTEQSRLSLADAQQLAVTSTIRATPRLDLTVTDGFVRSEQTRDLGFLLSPGGISTPAVVPDPSEGNPGNAAVLLPRGSALNNSLGVTAAWTATPRWTARAGYSNSYGRYTNPDGQNVVHRATAGVDRRLTPTLDVSGSYTYSRLNNTNAADSESQTVTVGAAYRYSDYWTVIGSAGPSFNRALEPGGVPQRLSATYSLAVTRLLEEWWGATASVSQNVMPSAGVAGSAVTLTTTFTTWARLGARLTGTVSASYTNFDASTGDFAVLATQAGLFYALWRNVSAGLIYGYRQRDAEPGIDPRAGATIRANSLRLQVTSAWEFPFDI